LISRIYPPNPKDERLPDVLEEPPKNPLLAELLLADEDVEVFAFLKLFTLLE